MSNTDFLRFREQELQKAFDWISQENVDLYQENTWLKKRVGTLETFQERYAILSLRLQHATQENEFLRAKNRRLAEANRHLQTALDEARQAQIDAPVLCKCGCGKPIKQAKTGRRRIFFSEKCKKKYYRKKKEKPVPKRERFGTHDCEV